MRHNGSERVPAGEKMEKDEKGSVADLISGRGAAFGCCHAHWKEQFENCKAAKCTNRRLGPDRSWQKIINATTSDKR